MQTSDGILLLFVAKLVCCGLLILAAAGLLGGVLGWLFGPGFWLVSVVFISAIGLLVWFSSPRDRNRDRGGEPFEKVDQ
jgi:hypothetical protein